MYFVRFLDDPGPIKLPLSPARYTTSTGAVRGSWCLQVHLASAFAGGGGNGTLMNLEAQLWIPDFLIAAALDSCVFLWALGVGVFYRFVLPFSAF